MRSHGRPGSQSGTRCRAGRAPRAPTLASSSSVRLVRASACRSRRWKSLGAMMAGDKKRRHRKLVTAMNGTFWGARESGGWAARGPSGLSRPLPVPLPHPHPACSSNQPPQRRFLPSARPHRQGAHLVLGAGEALAHAPEKLPEGGADHGGAGANGAAERAQQRPQVDAQRLRAVLQHVGLGLWAVQPGAPEWIPQRGWRSAPLHRTLAGAPGDRRNKASAEAGTKATHRWAERRKVDPGRGAKTSTCKEGLAPPPPPPGITSGLTLRP